MRRVCEARPLVGALLVIQLSATAHALSAQAPWPTSGWTVATPKARGLEPEPLADLHRAIQTRGFGYIDRMVVVRDGYLVINERYPRDYRTIGRGQDSASHQYNYTHPDWHPFFQGRDIHTLQSVTKSVTSVLIGIAIGRGEIAGTGAKLLSFLGDYNLSRVDRRLHDATVDDLLTMRSGIEWHESDRPLDDTNTTIQLEKSQDWVQFTLDQPMDAGPGEKWVYNSGGSQLMSAIIRKATGRFVDEYAEEHLFRPLGIRDFHWKRTPTRLPDTEGGLYLEAEQLAKIGLLYLNDGVWNGSRILPEGWVAASTARRVELANAGGRGYGYQWWRVDRGGAHVWAGLGFGGQFLVVIPQHRIVGVINSWNVFGNPARGILLPFIDALLAATTSRN